MKTIIGLGNPGKEYVGTRHNVGFLVVDEIVGRHGGAFVSKRSMAAEVAEIIVDDQRVLLVKPQTFMNASGRVLSAVRSKFPVELTDVIVVHDDADLPFGEVRFKQGGGSAGHHGMDSILATLPRGSSVARVRVGIGRPSHPDVELEDFVLGQWTASEEASLADVTTKASEAISKWIVSSVDSAQAKACGYHPSRNVKDSL